MNAHAFRHFYDYHFTENRKIWDRYVPQLLRLPNDLGVKTTSQDYVFYAYEHVLHASEGGSP